MELEGDYCEDWVDYFFYVGVVLGQAVLEGELGFVGVEGEEQEED